MNEYLKAIYPRGKIYVFDSLSTQEMMEVLEDFRNEHFEPALLVYAALEIKAKKLSLFRSMCPMRLFENSALRMLMRGHRLIPPHTKLDAAERADFITQYAEDKLPVMLNTDPIANLLGFEVGDIVRIARADGSLYFRLVCEDFS
jgi:DNA-directed RNA polymerase subunit H (RpoH/RPB5)